MKNEFLRRLDRELRAIPRQDRQEILSDIEEHFTIGFNEGKSEQEIVRELGDPAAIAKEALSDYQSGNAEEEQPAASFTRSFLAAIGLLFFNLVVVLGPTMGILGTYIAFCGVAVGFILSPILSIGALLFVDFSSFLFTFFSSLVLLGIGLLLGIVLVYVGKYLYLAINNYIKFNINVIRGRKGN